jgi:GNAT superfamily N-acetyltransferase
VSGFAVVLSDDAEWALGEAGPFLRSDPVLHNLVLTLLEERAKHPAPGRYGLVSDGSKIVGFGFQSPLDFHAAITPMSPPAVAALVADLAELAPDLPGVFGVADSAARFAGCWAETLNVGATPVEGQRLYQLGSLHPPIAVAGQPRQASARDTGLVLKWLEGFQADVGGPVPPAETIKRRVESGQMWLWEDDEPVALAGFSPPLAGVSRVGLVYTPPHHRRHGYAAAATTAATQAAFAAGAAQCILFTQLGNPQSNAIYRRLGYEAISENIRYRFDPSRGRNPSIPH